MKPEIYESRPMTWPPKFYEAPDGELFLLWDGWAVRVDKTKTTGIEDAFEELNRRRRRPWESS